MEIKPKPQRKTQVSSRNKKQQMVVDETAKAKKPSPVTQKIPAYYQWFAEKGVRFRPGEPKWNLGELVKFKELGQPFKLVSFTEPNSEGKNRWATDVVIGDLTYGTAKEMKRSESERFAASNAIQNLISGVPPKKRLVTKSVPKHSAEDKTVSNFTAISITGTELKPSGPKEVSRVYRRFRLDNAPPWVNESVTKYGRLRSYSFSPDQSFESGNLFRIWALSLLKHLKQRVFSPTNIIDGRSMIVPYGFLVVRQYMSVFNKSAPKINKSRDLFGFVTLSATQTDKSSNWVVSLVIGLDGTNAKMSPAQGTMVQIDNPHCVKMEIWKQFFSYERFSAMVMQSLTALEIVSTDWDDIASVHPERTGEYRKQLVVDEKPWKKLKEKGFKLSAYTDKDGSFVVYATNVKQSPRGRFSVDSSTAKTVATKLIWVKNQYFHDVDVNRSWNVLLNELNKLEGKLPSKVSRITVEETKVNKQTKMRKGRSAQKRIGYALSEPL